MSILGDGSVVVNFVDTGVNFAGNQFGYYLGTPPQPQQINFSDTSLNGDGFDHMLAFQGTGQDTIQIPPFAAGIWTTDEYILAWENTTGGGDRDYQDFVAIVESVGPLSAPNGVIPAPGAVLLGSIGISLVGWLRRRKIV